ncbi:MAG: tRNA epoxyqueuosine(34) reductase QueG [Actinobacteria bacterium]|nr:tRNA epoxyqueuosine(34) reductase QueG [Actinomycetota bacterium]
MGGLRELVVARGRTNGLDVVGIADASPFLDALHALETRRAAGLHADMQFTYRNPRRSTDPRRTLDGARTLVVGAVRYGSVAATPEAIDERGGDANGSTTGRPLGRIARYAVGDHDAVLRRALRSVAEDLHNAGHRAVVLADDNALVDRAAAHRAGIGWFGKSSNLLLADLGSWFVLGSVLTDAVLEPASDPVGDGCGTCRRCVDACPTGAIVADGVVDARRCLSWLLQSPEPFPEELRAALGDRIYGCDDCQEVCPPNRRSDRRGEGVRGGGSDRIDLLWMLGASDEDLLRAAGRWYVPGRDADHLRRNALLVLGNTGDGRDPQVAAALTRFLHHGSRSLVDAASWAARRLGRSDLIGEAAGPRRAS